MKYCSPSFSLSRLYLSWLPHPPSPPFVRALSPPYLSSMCAPLPSLLRQKMCHPLFLCPSWDAPPFPFASSPAWGAAPPNSHLWASHPFPSFLRRRDALLPPWLGVSHIGRLRPLLHHHFVVWDPCNALPARFVACCKLMLVFQMFHENDASIPY